MNIDKRIYLATAVAALVFGSALVLATPREPFADIGIIHTEAPLGKGIVIVHRADAAPPAGIVLSDEGGTGVRAPAKWLSALNLEVPMNSVHLAAR